MDRRRENDRRQGDDRMSQNAYTRIALRLRDLSPGDREWLLAQLAPQDCKRVSEALREHRGQALSDKSLNRPRMEGALSSGAGAQDTPEARLTAAPAARVKAVLAEQPDWAIALLLSADSWPWAEEFLDELVPERIRALRALASELAPRGAGAAVHRRQIAVPIDSQAVADAVEPRQVCRCLGGSDQVVGR